MNTSEKIASVVAQFIAADREEDRKRIAELERDNNAVVQCCGELRHSIDVYLAEIQRLTEKCAGMVAERNSLTVENNHLHAENKRLVETPAVKRTPQVGDKVRIIVRTDLVKYGEVGEIGTVTQVDSDRTAWVDNVGVGGPWCHELRNLEVIE